MSQSTPRPKSLKSQQPKIKRRPPTRTRSSMRSKVSIPRMQSTKCRMSNWRKKFYRCKIRTNKEMVLLSRQASLVKRDLLVVEINSMMRRMTSHLDLETIVLNRCWLPATSRRSSKDIYQISQFQLKFSQILSERKARSGCHKVHFTRISI